MDGYSDFEIFWRITLPIGLPAIFTTVILNCIILWNEFLYAVVLLTEDSRRTLPLGIMHFMGGHQLDVGMIATGLMIAIAPIILHLCPVLRGAGQGHDGGRRALAPRQARAAGGDVAVVTIDRLSKRYDAQAASSPSRT